MTIFFLYFWCLGFFFFLIISTFVYSKEERKRKKRKEGVEKKKKKWDFCRLSTLIRYLVDPASSDMLVSKIKPCTCQYKLLYGETANGSLNQL